MCGCRYDSERTRLRRDARRGLSVERSSVGLCMRERRRARKTVWEPMRDLFGSSVLGFRQKERRGEERKTGFMDMEHCTLIRHEIRDELAQLGHAVVRLLNMPHDVL